MGRKRQERSTTPEQRSALFKQYAEPNMALIYDTVASYTGNSSDVDDNYQETLMWILQYIDTYDPKRNILTWLITVTVRFVGKLEAKRSKNFEDIEEVDEDNLSYLQRYSPKSKINYRFLENDDQFVDTDTIISDMSVSDEMYKALQKTNPKYVRAFLLRHEEGLSLKEISRMESITENTAKMRIHMGKKALQKELTSEQRKVS